MRFSFSSRWTDNKLLAVTRAALCLALINSAMSMSALGQAISTPQPALMPREIMYQLLFREVVATQVRADALKAKALPDGNARNFYRTALDLSATDDALLKRVAAETVAQISVLDRRAAEIIDGVKRTFKGAPRSQGAIVPPPPNELAALEAQRTQIVLAAADSIASVLGPAGFRYFETMVRRHAGSSFKQVSAGAGR